MLTVLLTSFLPKTNSRNNALSSTKLHADFSFDLCKNTAYKINEAQSIFSLSFFVSASISRDELLYTDGKIVEGELNSIFHDGWLKGDMGCMCCALPLICAYLHVYVVYISLVRRVIYNEALPTFILLSCLIYQVHNCMFQSHLQCL